jgi:hypothetical protein
MNDNHVADYLADAARRDQADRRHDRWLYWLTMALGCLAVMALVTALAACGPADTNNAPLTPVTPVTHAAPTVAVPTPSLDGYGLSDAAMADRINELRTEHLGAYTGNGVAAWNLDSYVVPWVCQQAAQVDAPVPANADPKTWPAFWRDLSALVVSSGRCS